MKAFDEFLAKYFPEGIRADRLGDELQYGPDADSGAAAVWGQSHARERDEKGRDALGLSIQSAPSPILRHQRTR
jgi:hypothetical protein